jgi:hypothetical protein
LLPLLWGSSILSQRRSVLWKTCFYKDAKKLHENPSVSVLLCHDKDNEIVESALSRSHRSTIVAEYETKLFPKEILRRKLNGFYELLTTRDGRCEGSI